MVSGMFSADSFEEGLRVRRVRIRNHFYKVEFKKLRRDDGACSPPSESNRTIEIESRIQNPFRLMEVALHEGLHAAFWDMSEEAIGEAASDIARLIHAVLKERVCLKEEK